MKLTPVQKEALSHTPLFLAQSETNLNKINWMSNRQQKSYTYRTTDVLINKGLLEHPVCRKRGVPTEEIDELQLTDKAIQMGFTENLEDRPTEHDIIPKPKPKKKSSKKETNLIKELRSLQEIAEEKGLSDAADFISKIISA